ncbi:response regulator [Arenibacter sp. BSSL-BM3]|uniref:Response regulator n=1 Tax=Arenibacter arenosicollis TaxID=2762274 RepID=A0ABR7QR38_9FLAO|nr:response regulator [Arenibacter arenosicollis]MBC8769367.1 response regulator [Arenibacter arenosicollis]
MKYEVLVIDDDKILCLVLNKVIESSNLPSAHIFNKANSALEYITERNTSNQNFLVFLDINMPLMNGWEFLTALNSQTLNAKVHVSIITSSIDQNNRKKANEFDCIFDFLVRPVKLEDVVKFSELPLLKPFFYFETKLEPVF